MPNKLKDITGETFKGLTVLSRAEGLHEAKWLCKCENCGTERVYVGSKLRRLDASCTCSGGKDKNGLATSEKRLHMVWSNMKDRCSRKANGAYKDYGGRGIKVCSEWLHNFTAFCLWAKANGYRRGLEIDRIDNDGDYSPENCRFVTPKENCRNKRSNVKISFRGETHILVEWAEKLGVPAKILNNRIKTYGWSVERAFTTPHQTVAEAARNRTRSQA